MEHPGRGASSSKLVPCPCPICAPVSRRVTSYVRRQHSKRYYKTVVSVTSPHEQSHRATSKPDHSSSPGADVITHTDLEVESDHDESSFDTDSCGDEFDQEFEVDICRCQ